MTRRLGAGMRRSPTSSMRACPSRLQARSRCRVSRVLDISQVCRDACVCKASAISVVYACCSHHIPARALWSTCCSRRPHQGLCRFSLLCVRRVHGDALLDVLTRQLGEQRSCWQASFTGRLVLARPCRGPHGHVAVLPQRQPDVQWAARSEEDRLPGPRLPDLGAGAARCAHHLGEPVSVTPASLCACVG